MRYFSVLSSGLLALPFAAATIHQVTVGSSAGALEFNPEAISAMPGDQVVFNFEQKNHTATQSSFADPCGKLATGFDSGFMPVGPNVTDNFPTYTITINDTTPVWVYCRQAANTAQSHCGQGMVFAVNCGADGSPNSFTNFKNAALAIGQQLQAEANATSAAPAATATVATTVAASTPSASSGSTGTTTSSGAATTHTIIVGSNSTISYSPSEIQANVNDVVLFQFQSKNHTVTQSSFADPCRALSLTNSSATGFDSGFMPVTAGSSDFPTFSVTVNDTNPIWGYCRQTGHCGMGMVFAINPVDNGPKSFSAFQQSAVTQNGTNSTSTASGASPSNTSGAERTITVASLGLGLVGAVFSLLL